MGKIGIPDSILHEPGKLDPEMFAVMQRHCVFGNRILAPFAEADYARLRLHAELGASLLNISSSPILSLAADRPNPSQALGRDRIPLGAGGRGYSFGRPHHGGRRRVRRLEQRSPYKAPLPREKCFAILSEGRGKHFDPAVLDAFFASSADIIQVQLQCMDP